MALKGERVGGFVLDRRLARTVEGELWKARDAAGRVAAVRLFYEPEWAELAAAAGPPEPFSHPLVAEEFAWSAETRPPFRARAFIDGRSLAELLEHSPRLPLGVAIPVALQLARALEALHGKGLVHLDLRPDNVWLDAEGRLALTDRQNRLLHVGLVGRLFARTERNALETALRLRMRPYLAPEAQRGGSYTETPGPERDMFALGVLLYRVLTGQLPSVIDPRYPSRFDKRIPKVFDEVVLGCIERRVRARLPDARGLGERLCEGWRRAGFELDVRRPPSAWVVATPWRATAPDPRSASGMFRRWLAGGSGTRQPPTTVGE
ncbi:MAG: hypothetical protein D6776_06110 [Planctomycetota bacterium]|nr:MAG: hypothetical protein D6776_06110 [Planctomycetota bacterium]